MVDFERRSKFWLLLIFKINKYLLFFYCIKNIRRGIIFKVFFIKIINFTIKYIILKTRNFIKIIKKKRI